MRTRKGGQRRTVPADTSRQGRTPGAGGSRRNSCRIRPRKTKSSARASPSPRQDRAPQPKGTSARQGAPGTRNRSGGARGAKGPRRPGGDSPKGVRGPRAPGGNPGVWEGNPLLGQGTPLLGQGSQASREGTQVIRRRPRHLGRGPRRSVADPGIWGRGPTHIGVQGMHPKGFRGPRCPGGSHPHRGQGTQASGRGRTPRDSGEPGVRGGPQCPGVPGRKASGWCQVSGSCWAARRLGIRMEPAGTGMPPTLGGDSGVLGCTGIFWALLGSTGTCWALWSILGSIGAYWDLLWPTGLCWGLLEPSGIYWAPMGSIGV